MTVCCSLRHDEIMIASNLGKQAGKIVWAGREKGRRKKRGTCKVAALQQVGAVYGSGAPAFLHPPASSLFFFQGKLDFFCAWVGVESVDFG